MAAEEVIEQLKPQTVVLKVHIHCEGCKNKVKRILKTIDGVYKVDVDSAQQKVTVTGNVEAETLMKKLLKAGKHVELLSEKSIKKEGKKEGGKEEVAKKDEGNCSGKKKKEQKDDTEKSNVEKSGDGLKKCDAPPKDMGALQLPNIAPLPPICYMPAPLYNIAYPSAARTSYFPAASATEVYDDDDDDDDCCSIM